MICWNYRTSAEDRFIILPMLMASKQRPQIEIVANMNSAFSYS